MTLQGWERIKIHKFLINFSLKVSHILWFCPWFPESIRNSRVEAINLAKMPSNKLQYEFKKAINYNQISFIYSQNTSFIATNLKYVITFKIILVSNTINSMIIWKICISSATPDKSSFQEETGRLANQQKISKKRRRKTLIWVSWTGEKLVLMNLVTNSTSNVLIITSSYFLI